MKNILIIGEFPAPYRVEVFKDLSKKYKTTVFFELQQDANRDINWLNNRELSYEILDNKESMMHYIKILKNIRQFDCVIVYNNSLKFSMITELICIYKHVPCFIHCDGCFNIEEKNAFKKLVKTYLTKKAFACFAGSESAENYFLYYGAPKDKIFLHEFTALHQDDIEKKLISFEEKNKLRKELNIVEKKIIITVGRYIKVKGFDILLDVSRRLDKNVGIYIIGGKPTDKFVEYKQKYNLNNVHFIDFKIGSELKKYYLASDVFVLMTRGDTWGLVINEAMANGLPVITTDKCVAGTELVVDNINGYVIPVDDRESLYERLQELINDETKCDYMAKNNINKIQDNVVENIAKKHIEVIEKLIL